MINKKELDIKDNFLNEVYKKQPEVSKHFVDLINNNQLTHAYLFDGLAGSGKLYVAKLIAMTIFCENKQQGYPCGVCDNCSRIISDQYPDVIIISPENQSIKVDKVRFLKQEFSKSGLEGSKKIFIINEAEKMTNSSFNSLLKFIEEPTGNITSILLTEHKNIILPTIISRTQVIEFHQNNYDDLDAYLKKNSVNNEIVNLIKKLTNNVQIADLLIEDNWLMEIKSKLENWFYLMINNKDKSFINIQSEIMPLAKSRKQQEIIIDLFSILYRDVFNMHFKKYNEKDLIFQSISEQIKKMSNMLSDQKILDILSVILNDMKKIKHNLSFQNLLEMINLKIISIMDNN